jgi:hypothetical protein
MLTEAHPAPQTFSSAAFDVQYRAEVRSGRRHASDYWAAVSGCSSTDMRSGVEGSAYGSEVLCRYSRTGKFKAVKSFPKSGDEEKERGIQDPNI